MSTAVTPAEFWADLEATVDPAAYKPARNPQVVAARLEADGEPYYVLKQPAARAYLRLSEADFALWWQMDGRKTVKALLLYSLRRYRTLPIGRLQRLIAELRAGHFLQETPTDMYTQIEAALERRAPAGRGRRILQAFLHTEFPITGLDDFFTPLYRRLQALFSPAWQAALALLILVGGLLFGRLVWQEQVALTAGGGWSLLSLLAANLLVIGIHELAHGLTVKHYRRELHRGGFLIYWGFPAFFVDTRDVWLSPRRARIAVSWAGPHSGLVVGGLVGVALTAVALTFPNGLSPFWSGFLFQIGFIAYLSVFINLNPLLELDGYFILMDWLDMPDLRGRALRFWRAALWQRLRAHPAPRRFWAALNQEERIFTLFGGLALVYSVYALALAAYFWQTRLTPLVGALWSAGAWGRGVVLLATAVLVAPALYALGQLGWSQAQRGLEWLARRDLLARPAVLALLLALPLLALAALLWPGGAIWRAALIWLLHLAAGAALIGAARQLPGSRLQWALWALVGVVAGLALAWALPPWRAAGLLLAALAAAAAGLAAAWAFRPTLSRADAALPAAVLALGALGTAGLGAQAGAGSETAVLAAAGVTLGLAGFSPLLLNFARSRFALPWLLLAVGMLALPLVAQNPGWHAPVIGLWFYAGALYAALGALAQFQRQAAEVSPAESGATAVLEEPARLANAFRQFLDAWLASYEAVFGGRRLARIRAELAPHLPHAGDLPLLEISARCRRALNLAVDRLDDLAGTPFTQRAGQAAYDSLPWPAAETLGRHVLAFSDWGVGLARGFIRARDRRAKLVRQADLFAGFDRAALDGLLAIGAPRAARAGALLAHEGAAATHFFLVEEGTVGVWRAGAQTGAIDAGGYFGERALLAAGEYEATYRAATAVKLLAIPRDRFDPLWRADAALARQVRTAAAERELLHGMALFGELSPQELGAVAARLEPRRATAGELIVLQGQPRSHLFIVAAGQVEGMVEDETGARVIGRLGRGEHFGAYELLADLPYQAAYRAVNDCKLLLLDEPHFDQLAAEVESISHYAVQIGTGRLAATRRRLDVTAVLS